jgi:hypothetical protein
MRVLGVYRPVAIACARATTAGGDR